jgi:predicted nucleic acid-binding protein
VIVADASLVLAWLLQEPDHAPANDAFDGLARQSLAVPANWPMEIANGLRRAFRTGRLRREEIALLGDRLAVLGINVAPPISGTDIAALTMFAIDCNLSAYDAAYLRLALDLDLNLATVDSSLRAAAGRLDVPVIPR